MFLEVYQNIVVGICLFNCAHNAKAFIWEIRMPAIEGPALPVLNPFENLRITTFFLNAD